MCLRAGIILPAIYAVVVSLGLSSPSVCVASPADSKAAPDSTSAAGATSALGSNIQLHFDVAAGPLDKALRDFAVQASRNISYEPSIVAGLQSPAIKGEFTVGDALSLLLKGTKLRAVNINKKTIRILENTNSGARNAGEASHNHYPYDGDAARASQTEPGSSDSANSTVGESNASEEKYLEEIVVTGSHIRGESVASPVIELGREEIDRSGYTSVADLMLSLPQNFGGGYNAATTVTNSQVNNRYADNPTGASVPNLRGLGPGSTLTLVDGHRMASGLTAGGADIASIPLDAIDRIEVLTDSASAIYGSDAVAGVVNVILKRNYDGAKTDLSYGLATDGGGTEKRVSQLFGTRWDGGDALLAYEHRQQDAVDARDRTFASSALEPNSLLPQTKSDSLTLSATQDLSATISAFVDGLYVARDADDLSFQQFFPAPVEAPSTLRKYDVTAGFKFNLMHDWKATVFGSAGKDATAENTVLLTAPTATPSAAERLVGTVRSLEANADGGIATLPSGIVRLAVGAGIRKEGFADALGFTADSLVNSVDAERNVRYAFGELSIPLARHSQRLGLNALDLVVSGRNERYSDFGEKTVPKVGLVYVPTSSIKLRSTWGQAFRAPNLDDAYGVQQLAILDLPNPASSTQSSPVLVRAGGNPNLQPETAESWSIGADYSAPELSGLQASATLFDIKYTNRISSIANAYTALTDPLNAFFVTASPSLGLVQSIYDSYPPREIFNSTSAPFNPGKIAAILDDRMVNVASQTARGADLSVNYKIGAGSSSGLLFANAAYLDLTQKNTPQAPEQTLSGLAFYPAKFRMRGGATWTLNAWALTGIVNYLPGETNNQVAPLQSVSSWTTVDATLRFAPVLPKLFSGMHFTLAVMNIFDRNPPYVQLPATVSQGFTYDSTNTNPLGRFVSLQMSKEW